MNVTAKATAVKISPRKAGLVASLVRGRSVEDAMVILEHTPKKAAGILGKVISSAKANATNNHNMSDDNLIISELSIGPGVALKRFRPVAFGRAHPYKHHSSNIRVVLSGEAKAVATKTDKVKSDKKPAKTAKEKK